MEEKSKTLIGLEAKLDALKDIPQNKKKRSAIKRKITLEKKRIAALPKPEYNPKEVETVLDDLFSVVDDEELDLDELIEDANRPPKADEIRTIPSKSEDMPPETQSHQEGLKTASVEKPKPVVDNEQLDYLIAIKDLYGIEDNLYNLSIKFRYFLTSRNLAFANMTPQTQNRFVKIHEHYSITQISRELGL